MNRFVRATVVALLLAPFFLMLMVAGIFFLWENPWLLKWSWVPFPVCWALAYIVLLVMKRRGPVLWQPEHDVALHWTARDEAAWELVKSWADKAGSIDYDDFFHSGLYITAAQELADELGRHYHARDNEPLGGVTVPEVLTAIELAVADLREFVEQHVPGSHLVTIHWLQRASRIPSAWKKFRLAYDAVSLLWNPWGVLYRAASNRTVAQPMVGELERDAMAAVYQAYVLSVGKYLIELNSRRLKVGPSRWRQWMESSHAGVDAARQGDENTTSGTTPIELPVAVVGQMKAGKSSLVNALLGEHQAEVDLLPQTQDVRRYQLRDEATGDRLVLLDTPGYSGDRGERGWNDALTAAREAAIVVLVVHALQPARQPDVAFLADLAEWFAEHPERKQPPVLVAMTHIDQLSPPLEWSPPYEEWLHAEPAGAKDRNIRDALDAVGDVFGASVDAIVPVCGDAEHGRVFGVREWLEPALVGLLPRGEAKALLDNLHAQLDAGRAAQLWNQVLSASSLLLKHGFAAMRRPPVSPDPAASSKTET